MLYNPGEVSYIKPMNEFDGRLHAWIASSILFGVLYKALVIPTVRIESDALRRSHEPELKKNVGEAIMPPRSR